MSLSKPLVKEVYRDYQPSINVLETIKILLEYVPPQFLSELNEVVLTNAASLSRERRRQKLAARSRIEHLRGTYHPPWNTQPAWIEIFVDNTLRTWPAVLLKIPFFRKIALFDVLYHEIGHHLQHSSKENANKEAFADEMKWKLFRHFFRKHYWYLQPIILPIRASVQVVRRSLKTLQGSRKKRIK